MAELPIPLEALEDCGAILGRRGAGKSGTRTLLLEHELDRGRRCCLIDPKGDSWGIRLNPDGSPSRFQDVPIFGGQHGDLQLDDSQGEVLGELVATHDLSCVLDLSGFSVAGMRRFMRGFAAALFDKNRAALTLFVDEADQLAPQRLPAEMAMLLHHMESLIRQGRQRGILMWMLTQRPQILNKNLLSQAESLVAMRMTTSHDRGAIRDWMEAHDPEQAKRVEATLAQLAVGEAWTWVPAADFLERVQFPLFSTFDSMRTPRHGERVEEVSLAPIDMSAIAQALQKQGSIPAQDPKRRDRAATTTDLRLADMAEENDRLRAQLDGLRNEAAFLFEDLAAKKSALSQIHDVASRALAGEPTSTEVKAAAPLSTEAAIRGELAGEQHSRPGADRGGVPAAAPGEAIGRAASPVSSPVELHPMARRIIEKLDELAPARLTWRQLAALLSYSPDGGYFRSGKRDAIASGLVLEDGDYARSALQSEAGLDRDQAFDTWSAVLPEPAPTIMAQLRNRASGLAKTDLAAALGYAPTGGYFRKGLALLRQNGVSIEAGEMVRLADPLPGQAS